MQIGKLVYFFYWDEHFDPVFLDNRPTFTGLSGTYYGKGDAVCHGPWHRDIVTCNHGLQVYEALTSLRWPKSTSCTTYVLVVCLTLPYKKRIKPILYATHTAHVPNKWPVAYSWWFFVKIKFYLRVRWLAHLLGHKLHLRELRTSKLIPYFFRFFFFPFTFLTPVTEKKSKTELGSFTFLTLNRPSLRRPSSDQKKIKTQLKASAIFYHRKKFDHPIEYYGATNLARSLLRARSYRWWPTNSRTSYSPLTFAEDANECNSTTWSCIGTTASRNLGPIRSLKPAIAVFARQVPAFFGLRTWRWISDLGWEGHFKLRTLTRHQKLIEGRV